MFSKTSFLILPFLITFLLFSAVNADAAASEPVFDDLMDLIVYKNSLNLKGDVNSDYVVDEADLQEIGELYGDISTPEEPQAADLNADGKVDIYDFGTTGIHYGGKLFSTNAAKGGSSTMHIDPSYQMVEPDDVFNLYVKITTTDSIFAISTVISYNKTLVNATSVSEGDFLGGDGKKTYPIMSIDWENGIVYYDSTRYDTQTGISGSGTLLEMTFKALQEGMTPTDIITYELVDVNLTSLTGITIENGTVEVNINDPAEIDPISDQNVDEGQVLSFTVNATDPEGDSYNLTVMAGPGSMTGDIYSYAPGWDTNHDNEVSTVTIESEDEHGAKDTESFQLTVNDINRAPTIDSISDKQVDEGQTLSFSISGSDPESDTLSFSVKSGPGSIIGTTYSYSPGWDTNHDDEVNSVTIEATDGYGGSDTEDFQLTVNDINRAPSIDSYSPTDTTPEMDEGTSLVFNITASDPESDTLQYSWTVDGNSYPSYSPSYTYSPSYAESGTHQVTVTPYDGFNVGPTQTWTVTVNDVPIICTQNSECGTDGYVGSAFCAGLLVVKTYRTYTCNNPGTPSAYCSSTDINVTQETCTYVCSDGLCIANEDPVIDPISDQSVNEGQTLSFTVNVTDTYGDIVTLSVKSGPGSIIGTTYSYSPGWDTNHDNEVSTVTIEADDGNGGTGTESFQITVTDVNRAPSIYDYYPTDLTPEMDEGTSLGFNVSVSDPESDTISYSWELDGAEVSTATTYVYSPGYADSGEHEVVVTVSDGSLIDDWGWTVTVNDVPIICTQNSECGTDGYITDPFCSGLDVVKTYRTYTCSNPGTPSSSCSYSDNDVTQEACGYKCVSGSCVSNQQPSIDSYSPTSNPTIDEGENQAFSITASDPYDDPLTTTWTLDGTVVDNDNSYTYTSDYDSAGTYAVIANVSDGELYTSQFWTLTVNDVPIACYQDTDCGTDGYIGDRSCSDGVQYSFTNVYQTYRTYTCTNPGTPSASCSYEDDIQVVEVCDYRCHEGVCVDNQPPSIDSYSPLSDPTINEGESQAFSITASDDFGPLQTPKWYLNGVHKINGNDYTLITDYDSAGLHTVLVTVTDGDLTSEHSWTVTVNNVNRAPSIDSFNPTDTTPSVDEGSSLAFSITASDPESDVLTYRWDLDGSQVWTSSSYTYSPDDSDSGIHTVKVTVSDGSLTDTQTWTVTVNDVVAPAPDLTIIEGQTEVYPSNPVHGQWFQIIFVMKNIGEESTGQANWMVDTGTSDPDRKDTGPISLDTGGEITVYAWMKYANSGTYHPTIILDYLGKVEEMSETNNEQTLTVQVS